MQSTPDNSNLQGKSKKVRVIGSLKKIAESKVKNSFYSTVNILTQLIVEVSRENWTGILQDYKSERNLTKHSLAK